MLAEVRYVLMQPLRWVATALPCLRSALYDLARPLARLLLLLIPALILTVWLPAALASQGRTGLLLLALLVLLGQFLRRFFWHLRYRHTYHYRRPLASRNG